MKKSIIETLPYKRILELRNELYEHEFNCTMDEGWTIDGGFLAEQFLSLSEEGKKIYAMTHAEHFTEYWLNKTVEEFENMFDDQFNVRGYEFD